MAKYPDEAYQSAMDTYSKIPKGPLKDQAKLFMNKIAEAYPPGEAPPEEMLKGLQAILNKKDGGLTAKTSDASGGFFRLTPQQSVAGLALIVLSLAALSPIGASAAVLTYTAPIYAL